MQNLVRSKTIGVTGNGEGVQQGPVLVGTFFMVAEDYLPPTAASGTRALMSPAQGRPGCRSLSPWSRRRT